MGQDSTPAALFESGARVHCIGVAGVGMCALAQILRRRGAIVSGSDVAEEFHTSRVLKELGIPVRKFSAANITPALCAVVYSSAYPESHPERRAARELGIPQYAYAEALGAFFAQGRGLMVAGTHGKTTTTALVGRMWEEAGLDPTVIVGGVVRDWNRNARVGESDWIIIEGDEYQEKFLHTIPETLVLTSLDYDHPDYFPDKAAYVAAFQKLARRMDARAKIVTHPAVASLVQPDGAGSGPAILLPGQEDRDVLARSSPALFGEHNRANMLLCIAAARLHGLPEAAIKKTLERFGGVMRRLEFYTKPDAQTVIVDDYAHHPEEIRATLAAVRERFPNRQVVLVFQPHTFSRTAALFAEFAEALKAADHIFILEIYASQRERAQAISSRALAERIAAAHPSVRYVQDMAQAASALAAFLPAVSRPILITMGAGDVWKIARAINEKYNK